MGSPHFGMVVYPKITMIVEKPIENAALKINSEGEEGYIA